MECEGLETLCIKDQTLTNESMSCFIILTTKTSQFFFFFFFHLFRLLSHRLQVQRK